MRKLTLLMMLISLNACTTYAKKWHVHPDDMSRFENDFHRCTLVANQYYRKNPGQYQDTCLQLIGYRLEIVEE